VFPPRAFLPHEFWPRDCLPRDARPPATLPLMLLQNPDCGVDAPESFRCVISSARLAPVAVTTAEALGNVQRVAAMLDLFDALGRM
jgi:hypothetical protein